jgi:hypothetical protein
MKTKLSFLILFISLLTVVACQFQNMTDVDSKVITNKVTYNQIKGLSPKYSTNLMVDNYLAVGDVTLYSDDENVYVEYETNDEWYLKNIHLYVGDLELISNKKSQLPNPKNFPICSVCPNHTQSEIYMISKSKLPKKFTVSAQADVKREENGIETKTETAWCEGDRFSTDSKGMYFNVNLQDIKATDFVSL